MLFFVDFCNLLFIFVVFCWFMLVYVDLCWLILIWMQELITGADGWSWLLELIAGVDCRSWLLEIQKPAPRDTQKPCAPPPPIHQSAGKPVSLHPGTLRKLSRPPKLWPPHDTLPPKVWKLRKPSPTGAGKPVSLHPGTLRKLSHPRCKETGAIFCWPLFFMSC